MEKTWKPTAAGILILIAVLLSIVWPYIVTLVEYSDAFSGFVLLWYIPTAIIGIPVILAGILALRRRGWVYVLICSIAAWILYFLSGTGAAGIIYHMLPSPIDWLDPPWYIILFRDNSPLFGLLFLLAGVIATGFIFLSKEEFEGPL